MPAAARAAAASLAMLAACATLGALPARAQPADVPAAPRIVVAFANEPEANPGPAGATGSRYGGGDYRVGQGARREAHRIASTYSLRPIESWPIKPLAMYCVVYEITNGRPVTEVLAALAKDTRVLLAQPLQEFHTLSDPPAAGVVYNDPLYDLQTNLPALGIARAHLRTQGEGVRIALIDTGVDTSHPDLAGRIAHTHSYLKGTEPSAPSRRHGTAMAGLIAAVANNHTGIVGIAPRAELEVYEACWQLEPDSDAAACDTFTLAQALAAAISSGAALVNLSIAGPADPLLSALVQRGLAHGITFIAALAGPDAAFPAAIPGVLVAGGSERALPRGTFALPSEHVLTLRPSAQYDFESGSSVAAAELTGVVALLISAAPTHLGTPAIATLLSAPADEPPHALDVNGALARLAASSGGAGARVAAH